MIKLISFPHSGSNWIAYIIEHIFEIPVVGVSEYFEVKTHCDDINFGNKTPILKSHLHLPLEVNDQPDCLIYCHRDYKYCIASHINSCETNKVCQHLTGENPLENRNEIPDYIFIRKYFNEFIGDKVFIPYTLINSWQTLRPTILRLYDVLNKYYELNILDIQKNIISFEDNFDLHYSKSLGMYRLSMHQKKNMNVDHLKSLDKYIIDSNLLP